MMIRIIITTKDDNRQFNHTARKVSKYGVFNGPYFSVFSPNRGKYGPEKTPHLDTFHAVSYFRYIAFCIYVLHFI